MASRDYCLPLLLTLTVTLTVTLTLAKDVEILFLHTNDMHARFEQTSASSSKCSNKSAEHNQCYGGFARVANEVRAARTRAKDGKGPSVLFLNAGDTFQGTIWYTIHKWNIAATFINLLQPDAISLGNHEFDDGVEGLVPFITELKCPVLAANVNASLEPTLQATHLNRSVVLRTAGVLVGVIGYLTPDTMNISRTGQVIITDEVAAIKNESERLKAEGVNILVALGHSGFDVDQRIAREVPLIDLVVGGHTNTFLYNGKKPDSEDPDGIYPTIIVQPSGRKVPVVQAYAYTKYLGHLTMVFDENGEAKSFVGNPILLNGSVPQDEEVLTELSKWREQVTNMTKLQVGTTKVFLEGSFKQCRMVECNLGNLIADAFVYNNALMYNGPGWTDAPIAIHNGGGIRASIDASPVKGVVTMEDVISVLPFENKMEIVTLNGSQVCEMLEWSICQHDPEGIVNSGAFLQFSGLRVTYNVTRPKGKRVSSVLARCGDCRVPKFSPVEPKSMYNIIVPMYLSSGGDGYSVFSHSHNKTTHDYTDTSITAEYFKAKSPVYPGLEDRIIFCPNLDYVRALNKPKGAASSLSQATYVLVLSVLVLMVAK